MEAPKNIERPKKDKLRIFSRKNWANDNYWYVFDHTGRILTSGDLYYCCRYARSRSK